jgi:hypothetical protein
MVARGGQSRRVPPSKAGNFADEIGDRQRRC